MKIELYRLEKDLKRFLSSFLIVLTLGVTIGIIYLNYTTNTTPSGAIERYNGSQIGELDDFEIAESYPKQINELLLTTHNHVISFAIIFGLIGIIFYFNSVIGGFWKTFLIIEPLVSTVITFSSIWGIRYIHEGFVYLAVISALLMYASFYLMAAISLYELNFKSHEKKKE